LIEERKANAEKIAENQRNEIFLEIKKTEENLKKELETKTENVKNTMISINEELYRKIWEIKESLSQDIQKNAMVGEKVLEQGNEIKKELVRQEIKREEQYQTIYQGLAIQETKHDGQVMETSQKLDMIRASLINQVDGLQYVDKQLSNIKSILEEEARENRIIQEISYLKDYFRNEIEMRSNLIQPTQTIENVQLNDRIMQNVEEENIQTRNMIEFVGTDTRKILNIIEKMDLGDQLEQYTQRIVQMQERLKEA
jgi:hypothetical protein